MPAMRFTKSKEQTLKAVLTGSLFSQAFQYFIVIGIVQQRGIKKKPAVEIQPIIIKILAIILKVSEFELLVFWC